MGRNCPKSCGTITEKRHCGNPFCPWMVCEKCKIVFHPEKLQQSMKWIGGK